MQIVIPMSGFGERFRRAGYKVPKPLIEVDGRPIVEYIVHMFPGEHDFLFICNREHLEEPAYRMRDILQRICPQGRIVGVDPHRLGPVQAVLSAKEHLSDGPIVVNYCDFTCDWDWADFKRFVAGNGCDGAIPCYRGFHPHTLWSNYYAYVRETDGWGTDIQEKTPFTDDPRSEFASSGTYYFASRDIFLEYAGKMIDQGLTVGGEYYVSMAYKPMFNEGRRVAVYELDHFMQWGVPDDLEEYLYFSGAFRALAGQKRAVMPQGAVMLPMAGLGSRFAVQGYDRPKPLIEVSGRPMAVQALDDLPEAPRTVFILRKDLDGLGELQDVLQASATDARFVILDKVTDGQASTCMAGLGEVEADAPLTIAACDNGMIFDRAAFDRLMADPSIDVLVWGARGYPGAIRRPKLYGWIKADAEGTVEGVSVKEPLEDPKRDPIIVGAFTFKRASDFARAVERMKAREGLVNGEYYVDTAINDAVALGLRCALLPVDYYLCWGTPEDLKTFQYWQDCFDAWDMHPYSRATDPDFPAGGSGDGA